MAAAKAVGQALSTELLIIIQAKNSNSYLSQKIVLLIRYSYLTRAFIVVNLFQNAEFKFFLIPVPVAAKVATGWLGMREVIVAKINGKIMAFNQ